MDIFSTGFTGTDLVAGVADSVQTTFASLSPVLFLIGGLILAFIVVRYIIGLVKSTGKR